MRSLPIKVYNLQKEPLWENVDFNGELYCEEVAVIEGGTVAGLPSIAFYLSAPNGKKYVFETTGKILQNISHIVDDNNIKNFGTRTPKIKGCIKDKIK